MSEGLYDKTSVGVSVSKARCQGAIAIYPKRYFIGVVFIRQSKSDSSL